MSYTQDDRLMSIDTPLGKDKLLLTGFSGTEAISQPFEFKATMLSEDNSISFDGIIGKGVTISIALADGTKRYMNGIVSEFSQGRGTGSEKDASDPVLTSYSLTMVPWAWLLTRTKDLRIFQDKDVKEIVEQILTEKGFTDYEFKLERSYRKREYCVQYRETDLDFVSRLLEEEGICYYFEHEDGKHTMAIVDSAGKHKPCPNQATAEVRVAEGSWYTEDGITAVEKVEKIRAGKYTLKDYNFKMPNTDLKEEKDSRKKLGPGEREYYDYPGLYEKRSDGEQLTKNRIEEKEAWVTRLMGTSVCRAFVSGYKFKLKGHYRKDLEKDYLLVSLEHSATQKGYRPGEEDKEEFSYSNKFTCIPYDVQYRPHRGTAKPTVQGPQTAIVVGPAGEEIYTDEHGRVKVQFHWDREGKKDDKSSCWIRVSQIWAGESWGAMFIPRIGHEVIVDFLEGDPDRPIITGRVYHGKNRPPYPLDGEKNTSTIRSESTKGGGGFNEIRFDDTKGKEQVFLHAEKDMDVIVSGETRESVGGSKHLTVGGMKDGGAAGDYREKVFRDRHITVGGSHNESIGGAMKLTTGDNLDILVQGFYSEMIRGDAARIMKSISLETVGGDKCVNATRNYYTEVNGVYSVNTPDLIALKCGNALIHAQGGIELKAGGSSIVISPGGIWISGPTVYINSGAGPSVPTPLGAVAPTGLEARQAQPAEPDAAIDGKRSTGGG